MKLNVKAFALACGIVRGLGVFMLAWWIMLFKGAAGEVPFLGEIYSGFSIITLGSVIGLVWALVDGTVAGAIVAWLYNCLATKMTGPEK